MVPNRAFGARRIFVLALVLGASAMLCGAPPATAGAPELTLQAGVSSAPDVDGASSDLRWGLLRVSWGDRLQLRAEVPWLDLEGDGSGVAPPGIGPVSPTRRTRSGSGSGDDANQGGDSNNGDNGNGGNSGTTGSTQAPVTATVAAATSDSTRVRGLGDLRIGAGLRLAGGGSSLYRVDAALSAKLPTADADEGLGTGELDWRAGVSGEYRFWSVTAFGGLGYNHLGDPEGVRYDDVVDAYAGVESLPLADRFLVSGWLEGNPEVVPGAGARVVVAAGLRTLGSVRFETQVRAGLTDGAEDLSIAAGVSFGLRPPVAGPIGVRR